MIAPALKRRQTIAADRVREHFLSLLPAIADQARFAFRGEPRERRQELIAEVVANAFVAFVRLVERGLTDVIYPTPLAQFAIKQVRDGRRVGAKLNVRDVSVTSTPSTRSGSMSSGWIVTTRRMANGEKCCSKTVKPVPPKPPRPGSTSPTGSTACRPANAGSRRRWRPARPRSDGPQVPCQPRTHLADAARTAEGVAGFPGRARVRLSPRERPIPKRDTITAKGARMVDFARPKFSLGRTVATPAALRVIEQAGQSPAEFLDRHIRGDWGDLSADDRALNDEAVQDGSRIFSAYVTRAGAEYLGHHRGCRRSTVTAQRRRSCCRTSTDRPCPFAAQLGLSREARRQGTSVSCRRALPFLVVALFLISRPRRNHDRRHCPVQFRPVGTARHRAGPRDPPPTSDPGPSIPNPETLENPR